MIQIKGRDDVLSIENEDHRNAVLGSYDDLDMDCILDSGEGFCVYVKPGESFESAIAAMKAETGESGFWREPEEEPEELEGEIFSVFMQVNNSCSVTFYVPSDEWHRWSAENLDE
jgi:hypothetical protein